MLKSVANIRQQLAGKVPAQDQILLLGPPYKVPRDSTLRSEEALASLRLGDEEDATLCSLNTTERSGARRLFLFSKQHLSGSAPDLPPCILQPITITLPTEPDVGPIAFQKGAPSTSPLHQALEVYERQFMLHLCQGRALADGADLRIAACRSCIAEQSIIAQALRAAVSNLSFYRNNAIRIRTEITADFHAKTSKHFHLLDQFDKKMASLAQEHLHPSLVNVAKSSGRMIETLLDTVPVEREKVWAAQCRTAHERLQDLFREIDAAFGSLQNDSERDEEAKLDRAVEELVIALTQEVEQKAMQIRDKQVERLDHLTKDHGKVVSVVMNAVSGQQDQATAQVAQAAFSTLESMSKTSADILPCMKADDSELMDLMKRIGDTKTEAMKRMRQRLHKISLAQSSIGNLLKRVDFLRAALVQQNEDMSHLEHVVELKSSYRDFLAEIRRRRAFGNAVASSSNAVMERLAIMRSDEVKARERFLRGSGRHLMPAFFEIFAPTLATPPPLFNPQFPAMVEIDSLPDIGMDDHDSSSGEGAHAHRPNPDASTNTDTEPGGGSSSMECNQESSSKASASSVADADADADADNDANQAENTQNTQSNESASANSNQVQHAAMVSIDEHSSNEIMESLREDRANVDAERETLAYENAVLRQVLERAGSKSPRSYVEEARKNDKEKSLAKDDDVKSLKAKIVELEKALEDKTKEVAALDVGKKEEDAKTKEEIVEKLCDKISHSSFSVSTINLCIYIYIYIHM